MATGATISRYNGDTEVNGNCTMIPNAGYVIITNANVVMTLPTSATLGDIITIVGTHNTGGWQVALPAGVSMIINNFPSLEGAGHFLTSPNGSAPAGQYSAVTLQCVNVPGTLWCVLASQPASILSAATSTAFGFS